MCGSTAHGASVLGARSVAASNDAASTIDPQVFDSCGYATVVTARAVVVQGAEGGGDGGGGQSNAKEGDGDGGGGQSDAEDGGGELFSTGGDGTGGGGERECLG
eukprot:4774959-Prymnesium_polylepis.2